MNAESLQPNTSVAKSIKDDNLKNAKAPSSVPANVILAIVRNGGSYIDFSRTPLSKFERKLALAIAKMDSASEGKEQPRGGGYRINIPEAIGGAEVHFIDQNLNSLEITLQDIRTICLSLTKDIAIYRITALLDNSQKALSLPAPKDTSTPLLFSEGEEVAMLEANSQIEQQLSHFLESMVTRTDFSERLLVVSEIAKDKNQGEKILALCNFLQAMVDPRRTVAAPIRNSAVTFLEEVSRSSFKEAAQYADYLLKSSVVKYSDEKLEAIMNRLTTSQSVEASRAGLKRLLDYLQKRLLTLRQENEGIIDTSISELKYSITQARSCSVFPSSPQELIRGFQAIEAKLQQIKLKSENQH